MGSIIIQKSHRQSTLVFTVPNGERGHKCVCKSMFMNIFSISQKEEEWRNNIQRSESDPIIIITLRLTYAWSKNIRIKSIPRGIIHYSRKKSSKEYLSPHLSISSRCGYRLGIQGAIDPLIISWFFYSKYVTKYCCTFGTNLYFFCYSSALHMLSLLMSLFCKQA